MPCSRSASQYVAPLTAMTGLADALRVRPALLRTGEAGLVHHRHPVGSEVRRHVGVRRGQERSHEADPLHDERLQGFGHRVGRQVTGRPVLVSTKLRNCAAAATPSGTYSGV